jgi:cell division protein FtsN
MDERDDSVGQLYRRSSREEPPAHLDLTVMEMARRAARRRSWSPFGGHRLATGALAAVALLSVVLVTLMQDRSEMTALPPAVTGAAGPGAPEAARAPALEAGRIRLPLPPPGERRDRGADAAGKARPDARHASAETTAEPGDDTTARQADAPVAAPAQGPPQPRFDFYRTLPETRVAAPEPVPQPAVEPAPEPAPQQAVEPAPVAKSSSTGTRPAAVSPVDADAVGAAPRPAEPSVASVPPPAGPAPDATVSATGTPVPGYYLQVGAFSAADSADRLRARLQALQLPAGVEAIVLENREVVHRVRVGPYADMAGVERARTRLQAEGIDSLLVRTPQ